jgi:uncharacterized protein YndB with AHSA1/START domain
MHHTVKMSAAERLLRRRFISAGALGVAALAVRPRLLLADDPEGAGNQQELSRNAEAIHQERLFKASPKRVYAALTTTAQFDQVIRLSGVMKRAALAKKQAPTAISVQAGGSFSLFGGYIIGRQIELVPQRRIVQAWRVTYWPAGVYSVAHFELADEDGATKLTFDHTGFPVGKGAELVTGWQEHYWGPLEKFLG